MIVQNCICLANRLGKISKQGDQYLRWLLVAGAMTVIRHAKRRGASTQPWLDDLIARRPTKVAAVALANKMARTAWALLSQALVVGKLLAPIPCERAAQLPRQMLYLSCKRGHDTGGIFVLDPGQHRVAGVTLNERDDVAVLRAGDQVAFPVAGDGAVLLRWPGAPGLRLHP